MSARLRDMKRNIPCSQLTWQLNITIINRKYISNWSIFQPGMLVSLRVYLIRSFLGDSQVTIFLPSTIDHNYHSIFAALLQPETCTVRSTGYSFRISTYFYKILWVSVFWALHLSIPEIKSLTKWFTVDSFCLSFWENFTQENQNHPQFSNGSPFY